MDELFSLYLTIIFNLQKKLLLIVQFLKWDFKQVAEALATEAVTEMDVKFTCQRFGRYTTKENSKLFIRSSCSAAVPISKLKEQHH